MAGTTHDKLALLRQIKEAFRTAITGKGQTISDSEPFSAWPAKVTAIESGGADIKSDNFGFDTLADGGATLVEDGYVLVRVPVDFDISKVKFLMVSVSGILCNSATSTSSDYETGIFASSGVMDNRDGTNTDFLFTGNRAYSYVYNDGDLKHYSWDDNDLPFYNSTLNCLEFRVAAPAAANDILSAEGDLYYWYF